eukprot:Rhum_TRINITY_DN21275_c0_g1::Rhum_TRINITY_DN21275_c0_g1_i1::g.173619::m.173619
MGIKGKKRKLRLALQKAEAAAAEEGGASAASDNGFSDDGGEDLPQGVGPSMDEMRGGGGGGMKMSMRLKMQDEEQIAKAIKGEGAPRRKKKKPWWERRAWWQGKVPEREGAKGDDQVEAVAYYPPVDLPTAFASLGVEKRLLRALGAEGFTTMTEIQRRCIPELMLRRDLLGQAKTGSGKTLAFVVPMLSDLLEGATPGDVATRALIVSPVKELCLQIHSVCTRLLSHIPEANVNSTLITGGTKVSAESRVLRNGVTLVVATPGRLLDHMRHTKGWQWRKMIEWLVIDEADRVLMEGFSKDVDQILQYVKDVPRRTTALFSATMARGMRDLGRLSFCEPPLHVTDVRFTHHPDDIEDHRLRMEEAVREQGEGEEGEEAEEEDAEAECDDDGEEEGGVPTSKRRKMADPSDLIHRLNEEPTNRVPVPDASRLQQVAMVVEARDKFVRLYKLLRELDGQGAKKMIVFFASCASAQFNNMMMNTILNGSIQCLMLHGKMKHRQRVATFEFFCEATDGVLFCTDVVARGLDIPAVEWIIQYDPPTDPSEYLHRVGRTARGGGSGNAMLLLCPKERGFLDFLRQHGVEITERDPKPIDSDAYLHKMHQLLMRDNILEKNARAAYKATVMAYQQHTLKQYFNVKELPLHEVAEACCLGDTAPQVHLTKTDGERAPYVNGILKSMKKKYANERKWEKGGKAKQQWSEDGTFVGRKQNKYVT